jgi:hypothetical protein
VKRQLSPEAMAEHRRHARRYRRLAEAHAARDRRGTLQAGRGEGGA